MTIADLILQGRYAEAVRRLGRKDPARVLHPLEATGVRDSVVAHMCLGQFTEAAEMADALIAKFPRAVSWDYIHAGMIRWFQGQRKAAAQVWSDGLTCGYTSYRGIDCALLLWYASVRSSSIDATQAIERMDKAYFRGLRIGYFVDAIVRYILGEIDVAEARRLAENESWESGVAENHAELDFYIAAKSLAGGNRRGFKKHMTACATAEGLIEAPPPTVLIARFEVGMFPFQFPHGDYTGVGHPTKKVRDRRRTESPKRPSSST